MSEPLIKPRPMIDLDEFERRLGQTAAAPAKKARDPLAELARLVEGGDDPYAQVFTVPAAAPETARRHDFAAIEAGLRGSIDPREPHFAAEPYGDAAWNPGQPIAAVEPQQAFMPDYAAADDWRADTRETAAAAPRSRRPLYVMGVVVAFGVVGIGTSMALKSRLPGSHEVAVIKAAPGPTKVQPDTPGGTDVANQDASILDKGTAPSKVALVDRAEQPVDLSQIQPRPSRTVAIPAAAAPGAADAAPIPPSASQTPPTSIAARIEPKKVKTVSVKPDGSLLTPSTPAAQTIATLDGMPPQMAAPVEPAATPQASTPAARPAPKVSARIVPPKPVAAHEEHGAAPLLGLAAKAKPTTKPVRVAEAETDGADAAPAGGGFAVQLAAPGSEPEAKTAAASLQHRFAGALGGRHTSIHKAMVGDKAVYRIRVGGLSHEEAAALCKKLQAGGGSCFVAKN